MNAALAVKPLPELAAEYGAPRILLNSEGPADITAEQEAAYQFNLLGGLKLRESTIVGAEGTEDLIIRCVEYIDPVTQRVRYAVDYWSVLQYGAFDMAGRAMAEIAYEAAVRGEFASPTLPLSLERFTRGLASFYDVTDVQP
ncbi:hypothetical protein [Streptomyces sp. NPDC000880]